MKVVQPDDYVLVNGARFRVCQVRHEKMGQQFVPHVILQEEAQRG